MNTPIILYVDDEKPNRVVFEATFGKRFPITTVASGREALEVLKAKNVGVIVVDQRMPEMSGNELLTHAKEANPIAIRLVLTAYGDVDPILEAVNDGLAARYLLKPWDKDEMDNILSWGMEAYLLGQANSALQMRLLQTERLATLGSIGGAVIHDINQPLSYLLSNTERVRYLNRSLPALKQLLSEYGHTIDEPSRRNLVDLANELPDIASDMMEGCQVMQNLTTQIRRMIRPTVDPGAKRANTMEVIKYAVNVCRDIAIRARGSISYDGAPVLPAVRMNQTELNQVLINLVSNAAQAIERRGEPGGRVSVKAIPEGDRVRFVISDNGPGMTEDVVKQLGAPFFTTRAEGTGLGVNQCRRLVEKAGGSVVYHSVPGEGTTVAFTLEKA